MFYTFGHVRRRSAGSLLASLLLHVAAVIAIVTLPLFVAGPRLDMNLSTAAEIVFPLRAPVSPARPNRPVPAKVKKPRQPPASPPTAVPVEKTALVRPPQLRIEPRLTESPKLQLASPDVPRSYPPPTLEQVRPAAEPAPAEPRIQLGGFTGVSVKTQSQVEVAVRAVDSFGAVKPDRQGARWRTTNYERSGFDAALSVDGRMPKDVPAGGSAQAAGSFGPATAASPLGGPPGTVHNAGFGHVVAGERKIEVERTAEPESATTAARVLAKPLPQYTDEARRLRIEGDVRLRVNFRADATVEVLQVIEGLGHGLDETAVRAARRIEFAPAEQSGKPVDFVAEVFIRFRLAY